MCQHSCRGSRIIFPFVYIALTSIETIDFVELIIMYICKINFETCLPSLCIHCVRQIKTYSNQKRDLAVLNAPHPLDCILLTPGLKHSTVIFDIRYHNFAIIPHNDMIPQA